MKKQNFLYFLLLFPLLEGCVANQQTGEMETGWLFWVFIGLLLGVLFIGAIYNLLKKKRPDNVPTKAEQEIEAFEETLQHKPDKEEGKDSETKKP